MTKVCTGCHETKPADAFSRQRGGNLGRRARCRSCMAEQSRAWRASNPERSREAARAYRARHPARAKELGRAREVKRRYGIALEVYDRLLQQPCEICGRRIEGKGPRGMHVDHDHATGEIRGVLCATCNIGLGHFRDDPALLMGAIAYLEGDQSEA